MKRNCVYILIVILLAGTSAQADGVLLQVSCIDRNQPDRVTVWFGYESASDVAGTGYIGGGDIGIVSMPPNGLLAGRHERVFAVEVYDGGSVTWQFAARTGDYELTASAETGAPDCNAPTAGVSSVTVEAAPGCYTWQYLDNIWHDVRLADGSMAVTCSQEEGGRVFVRLTVSGHDADPSRWRIEGV